MFKPSKLLLKYVNTTPCDIYGVVGALIGYINGDPMFLEDNFDKAVKYVLDHGVSKEELFSEFDPKLGYEQDPQKWDEKYYATAIVRLNYNFCDERIQHVKKVAKKIYQTEREKNTSTKGAKESEEKTPKKTMDQQNINRAQEREIPIGLLLLVIIVVVVIILEVR